MDKKYSDVTWVQQLVVCGAIFLSGCSLSPASSSYKSPEDSGLQVNQRFPNVGSVCVLLHSNAKIEEFEKAGSRIIACPKHEQGAIADLNKDYNATKVKRVGNWVLFRVAEGRVSELSKAEKTIEKPLLQNIVVPKAEKSIVQPLFRSSVTSNDLDFITDSDPSSFKNLEFVKRATVQMPDKHRKGPLLIENVFVFQALFMDDTEVLINLHSDFESQKQAYEFAKMVQGPLGKLPSFMRARLSHVNILNGDYTAFAEDLGHFIVLYSENMKKRIATHDLEETVFHESVHATLDLQYETDAKWLAAQLADGTSITDYAANKLKSEDLAETALFAYTMIKHPGRLPSDVELWVKTNIPNRLEFLKSVVFTESL